MPQRELDAERAFACGGGAQDGENRPSQSAYILAKTSTTTSARRIKRPSCCGRVGSAISSPEVRRILVIKECDREER
jgi:hypothetical protein